MRKDVACVTSPRNARVNGQPLIKCVPNIVRNIGYTAYPFLHLDTIAIVAGIYKDIYII